MENNKEKQVRNQKTAAIIIATLLLISIILNVVFMLRSKNMSDANKELTAEMDLVVAEKEDISEAKEEYRSLLDEKRREAANLEQEVKDLEENIRAKDVRIVHLTREVRDTEELNKLKAEHEELKEEHSKLKEKLETLNEEIAELSEKHEDLQEEYDLIFAKAEESKKLNAYNITVRNRQFRFIFRDRYVDRARRVDNTYINFEVHSSVFAETGERDIHILLYDPYLDIMYPGSDTFEKEDETQSGFTTKRTIMYEGDPVLIEFDIEHDERLYSGNYYVEVYVDGRLTRTKGFMLE